MNPADSALWSELRQAGLLLGQEPEAMEPASPWYIKLLLAFSGWFAAIFFLGFIGVGFERIFRSDPALLITGTLMLAAAFALLRMPRNEFLEHLAFAVSLAGQALLIWFIYDHVSSKASLWLYIALLQTILALLMPNFVHRVVSSFAAAAAVSVGVAAVGSPGILSPLIMLAMVGLWLHESRFKSKIRHCQAFGYGLTLALILITATSLGGQQGMRTLLMRDQLSSSIPLWLDEVLLGAVALYLVWQLLRQHSINALSRGGILALAGTLAVAVLSLQANGIIAGLTIMLLGFARGNRILLALGIVSLLFFLAAYYYQLDVTLLRKSGILLATGLTLLTARWLLQRMPELPRENSHER